MPALEIEPNEPPNQPDWLVEIRAGDPYQRGHRAAVDLMVGYTAPPPVTDRRDLFSPNRRKP